MAKKKTLKTSTEHDTKLKQFDCVKQIAPAKDNTYTGKKCGINVCAKAAIAYYIADQLIPDAGNIFFDAGSTLTMAARAAFICANEKGHSLMVTTNNMDISEDFLSKKKPYSPDSNKCDISLQLTGGKHDRQHHALFGLLAASTLENVYPEAIFMGVTGFRFEEGLFYHGANEEQSIKTALYSKEVCRRILVFDHSKMGKRDVFLCKNLDLKAIEGLCKNSAQKTIIVTSRPDGDSTSPEVQEFEKSLEVLNESQLLVKLRKEGKLEAVVVRLMHKKPYYEVVKKIGLLP
ncbi:MAG: DeoR/GlpR transcriptional regulator [Anaerohalosphaera sp.]|nr:DeoR/GlpR transcriptional regulator [Anaerohalosphaera sp.]